MIPVTYGNIQLKRISYMRTSRTILNLMLGRGVGGLEYVFVQHTLNFHKLGYQSVAVCHPKSPYISQLHNAGIEVLTMGNHLRNPFAWIKWIWILKHYRPNVVCMHGNRAIAFGIAKWLRLIVRPFPKLMATTHNTRNKRFKHLDGCFAITRILQENLIHAFGIPSSKIFYCPNAAPRPRTFKGRTHRTPLTIGFLGRHHPDKGGDILLEACRILKREGVPFRLEMAGEGPLREQYQEFVKTHQLESKVHFCGWIDGEDKDEFFKQIDVLCLPSRREGLPVALLEGLSYATPLVVSSCPGMVNVIKQSPCGIVFPMEDVAALAEALKTMATDVEAWKAFSQCAGSLYNDRYTIERQRERLEKGIFTVCKH